MDAWQVKSAVIFLSIRNMSDAVLNWHLRRHFVPPLICCSTILFVAYAAVGVKWYNSLTCCRVLFSVEIILHTKFGSCIYRLDVM